MKVSATAFTRSLPNILNYLSNGGKTVKILKYGKHVASIVLPSPNDPKTPLMYIGGKLKVWKE